MRLKPLHILFTTLATLVLSGCKNMLVLEPRGLGAADEKHLLIEALSVMLILVVPVIIMTLLFAWRYRAGNKKATYRPDFTHSTILEIVWWGIPCAIIVALGIITWETTHSLDPYKPIEPEVKPLNIQVIALNWKWLFIYPDQGIATLNYVEMPVNVPVKFSITSDAPMNSFQIYQLAGQIYAMAGMQTKQYILADDIGDYRGQSVSFSGAGFPDMNFPAKVRSQAEFNSWVKQVQASPQKLNLASYNQLVKDSTNDPAQFFVLADPDLFNTVIMKYMGPMPADRNMNSIGQ